MRCPCLSIALALVLPPSSLGQAPVRPDFAQKLQHCRASGLEEEVFCGRYEVRENRRDPSGRTIALNLVVLPATTDSVASDALVFLAGGGVVPATRYAGFLARAFPNLRRHRDILLADQRGTWNSNPLSCDQPDGASAGLAGIGEVIVATRGCRDALAERADLRAYNTAVAMDDLDAVRGWLGYQAVNLYGVSYGTKAAQVYLRQHPGRVRSAVLYGVVPLSVPSQLDLASSAQASLERVFGLCARDAACGAAFPNLPAEFDSLLSRLAREPTTLEPPSGSIRETRITDRALRDLVQSMLGAARAIERLPLLIHSAYLGDYHPVALALAGKGQPPPPPAPRGLFLSIICSEAIPQIDAHDVSQATRGSFFGDAPVRSQMRFCADWPRASLPNGFWVPVRAQVPVLALSGDLDPITPPRYGEVVVQNLANGLHIVLPNRSHNDVDPCITSMFEGFLIAGGAAGLDTSCVAASTPLRFATKEDS
jgi:pimeloyl-ACP methyl ester carboxylesterase